MTWFNKSRTTPSILLLGKHIPWRKVNSNITPSCNRAAVCLKSLRAAWSEANTMLYPKHHKQNSRVATLKLRGSHKLFSAPWQNTCCLRAHKKFRNILILFSKSQQNNRNIALRQVHSTKTNGSAGLSVLLWSLTVWCFASYWANNARKTVFSNQKECYGCIDSMGIYYSAQILGSESHCS